MDRWFWGGGYSPDGGGTSAGIRVIAIRSGVLHDLGLPPAESPSWVATHPRLPVLYAALEHRGEVAAYGLVDRNRLKLLGKPLPAGELVCHVAVVVATGTLVASCCADGKVLAYPINTDGSLAAPSAAPASIDPFAVPGHQRRVSRSPQSTALRSGRIMTTDLGHDSVRAWDLVGGELQLHQQLALRKGDGPRQLVEHPSGLIYVVTEHSAEVIALGLDADDDYREISRCALGENIRAGEHFPAEISLDLPTNRVYVGVRGARVMAMLGLKRGRPDFLGSASCVGEWLRHHVHVGNIILVANRLSNTIEATGLDPADGLPRHRLGSLALESPTCIAEQVAG